MQQRVKAVIFDLDGTLLDTLRDISDSGNAVLEELGYPIHAAEAYRGYVGDGLRNLAFKVLPSEHRSVADLDAFVARYREIYAVRWQETSAPFSGIPQMLTMLSERGLRLAVLSNKRDDFTKLCVARFLSTWTFEVVRGELAGVPLKPEPEGLLRVIEEMKLERSEVVYVGDSEIDVETALRAEVECIGVTWGFRSRQELLDAGAKRLIERPTDIASALEI